MSGADIESSARRPPREVPPFLSQPAPRLPRHDRIATRSAFGGVSLVFHAAAFAALLALASSQDVPGPEISADQNTVRLKSRIVFLASPGPGGGGGGGGRGQRAPIRRAQMPGRDAWTLPVATPIVAAAQPLDVAAPAHAVALDAKPLASGSMFQVGLPDGSVGTGTSYGSGSGGGVGDGGGTGIGSGRGPGLGPGSGGGTGGGVYRGGSGVTPPTLLFEVKPRYTPEALRDRVQGTVRLEVVVKKDGVPTDIRVIRSLEPDGLDQEAILAVQKWRFTPGRLDGVPVAVLVVVELSFRVR